MMEQRAGPPVTGGRTMVNRVCNVVWCAVVLTSITSIVVEALPILGPDLNRCHTVIPPRRTAAEAVDCCLLRTDVPIKDFKFNLDLPMRVRRPAHKLDDEFIEKYDRGLALMKALPADDPRSFEAQWKLHCSYCAEAYDQFNTTEILDVHHGWLVLPFHRYYVYFHERIIAKLLGDDTFAIPYWAWDVQYDDPPGNIIPPAYTNKNSSLYDELRSAVHQPPARVDLEFFYEPTGNKEPEVLLQDNLYNMWRTMISEVKTPEAFFGGKFSKGDSVQLREGPFEVGPHAAVHGWTGSEDSVFGEDMSPAYSAARDEIFFAHHSQIDRLWLMWLRWGGKDHDHEDYLNAEFLFYDENGDLVRVNVRDSLNWDNFRVTYEEVAPDWLSYQPKSIRDLYPEFGQVGILQRLWRQVVATETYRNIAMALGSSYLAQSNQVKASLGGIRRTATARVSRSEVIKTSSGGSSGYDEVLIVTGTVEKPFDVSVLLNMFLELPEADESTPHHVVEYLGGVRVEAEGLADGMDRTVSKTFIRPIGIGERIGILGIKHRKSLTVTFVPAWDSKHDAGVSINITDLKVEMKLVR